MIPTSLKTEKWLRHVSGTEQILNTSGVRKLTEAVELNQRGEEIVSSYGKKEFTGMVGFIDMRGFSNKAKGKTPLEVHNLVTPFISTVVEAATKHECFVDKSIGDEVMVVMPWFENDTVYSDVQMNHRQYPLVDLSCLLFDIIKILARESSDVKFSSGFAFGKMLLDQVGNENYSEWTVYGNCVNAAKRLQSRQTCQHWSEQHILAVGALESEYPKFDQELKTWIQLVPAAGPLKLVSPIIGKEDFKGVGSAAFVHSAIEPKPECL
jgi:class 3 adenylate cyclase